ncbi:hypothetical protein JYK14_03335 [Siccirubricoccus sp. KC 17139]|uniref:Peptidase M15A C-terminal domain-containing protein n=1 Tax=Siccirubricoccus soli TaxID=2899147 RepID=A0ABT1CZX2_9PROT|nr:hypothetical protein [Siccirubricoccus soli]MCO6415209.1 hypothetical protein [Siccirubricoccus soli]MCP2681340.1 hypothetical protein [Siccirubricoccus soli]
MLSVDLDAPCGRFLRLRDLVEAGETWQRTRVPNLPERPETILSMHKLAEEILDPVIAEFGPLEVTYGFSSRALARMVPGRIDPTRDQHAGHELKEDGTPICSRLGQAADFRIEGICSGQIAHWIVNRRTFDRMYFYGADRPLHISIGPEEKRALVTMLPGPSGRRVPQVRPLRWLADRFG